MSELLLAGTHQSAFVGGVGTVEEVSLSDLPLNEAVIILMLKRRTADLDAQVSGVMRAIDQQTNNSEEIQQKIEVLHAIDEALQADHSDGSARLKNLAVTIDGTVMSADEALRKYGIEVELTRDNFQAARERQLAYEDAQLIIDDPTSTPEEIADAEAAAAEAADWLREEMGMEPGDSVPITGEMKIKSATIQAAIAQLETQSRQANSANELQMVRMQTAMQQRSQVITMATQMIKSISDTNQAIARNM